jgi:hypothetical protein
MAAGELSVRVLVKANIADKLIAHFEGQTYFLVLS